MAILEAKEAVKIEEVKQNVLVSNLLIARSHLRNSAQTSGATSNYVFPLFIIIRKIREP